jgi:peptide/nickel transport system ATP-binding protein
VPELGEMPAGCAYAERCPLVISDCRTALPPLVEIGPAHAARCIRVGEVLAA